MDEFGSPIAGGIRGIRRSVSSSVFTGRAVPPPAVQPVTPMIQAPPPPPQPDPQTTRLLSENSLTLTSVSNQLSSISEQILALNSSLSVIKSNLDISDQLDRQREAAKQKREAILAEQGLREGKESELEKKIQFALLAPVRRVAGFAQSILGRLGNFLFILAAGWLTDRTLSFLRLTSEGNVDKLNEFKRKFLIDLAILGAIGITATIGISKLVATIGSIAGLGVKFAFSTLLAKPFGAALAFLRKNIDNFRKQFVQFIKNLVKKGPGKLLSVFNPTNLLLGGGALAILPKQIKKFFGSMFGKKLVTETAEGATKTAGRMGLKGATKFLGPVGIGLDVLFAGFDFFTRKKEGQSTKEAGLGAGGSAAGGIIGALTTLALIPEPISSAIGLFGLGILSAVGFTAGSMIGGKVGDEASGLNARKRNEADGVKGESFDESSSIEGRADGGPVDAKKSYIVGEKGPELFSSDIAGMISPLNFKKDSKVSDLIASFGESAEVTVIPLPESDKSLPSSATMATSSSSPSDYLPNIPSSDFANNFIGFSESVYNVVV